MAVVFIQKGNLVDPEVPKKFYAHAKSKGRLTYFNARRMHDLKGWKVKTEENEQEK
ncbi:MAG: hypothetical protein LBG80_10080 [Bacteroidales bacterium]|jgi:hypothetical protein|nr:hypothetical protein [Bacteroidales bacterium]